MKLVRYTHQGRTAIGVVHAEQITDVTDLFPQFGHDMRSLLTGGDAVLDEIRAATAKSKVSLNLSEVHLEAPIANPSKFLAIGMNYQKHAEEARQAGIPIPTSQLWFNKQVSCVNGPFDAVVKPAITEQLDYEAEMGVVIGRRAQGVSAADAMHYIAGYTIMNDVSVRDWQMRSPTFTLGKSFDTHGPVGPWIITRDEVPDPHTLNMRMLINGEIRQNTVTGDMIYNIFDQIAYLSIAMTLEPGDLIATGTPSGVGIARKPPAFLKVGDKMRVEIDGIGHIENEVIAPTLRPSPYQTGT